MKTKISNIKKEIRTLGVLIKPSKHNHKILVGVVFRGHRWLDGVMSYTTSKKDTADALIKMVIPNPTTI